MANNLFKAVKDGDVKEVKNLIDSGVSVLEKNNAGWTALHMASCSHNLEIVKLLIELGSNVLEKNNYNSTALHYASSFSNTKSIEIVRLLLESGMSNANTYILEKNNYGCTALHLASSQGHLEIVKLLVESGADILEKDNYNETALHVASRHGHLDIVKFLIQPYVDAGADLDTLNSDGKNIIYMANTEEIKEFLIEQLEIQKNSYILK